MRELKEEDENGYFLEVDLHFPEKIHDDMYDYLLAAENLEIFEDMLSTFQKEHFPEYAKKRSGKLALNLLDKERYWTDIRNYNF